MKIDHQFHTKIIELTGNRLILDNMKNIRDHIILIGTKVLSSSSHFFEKTYSEHEEIVEALKREDLEEVIQKVQNHIKYSHKRLLLI